ncbi:MAG TPA: peptidoglycan DD-metalloendopeptidase family protein [Nitrospiria bacterium]|jgi:murein DD-endopeptidase MepM/ murein hydrolase activator NlpD
MQTPYLIKTLILFTVFLAAVLAKPGYITSVETPLLPELISAREHFPGKTQKTNHHLIHLGQVLPGETFFDLMKKHQFSDQEIHTMNSLSQKVFNLKKIKKGSPYTVFLNENGEVTQFELDIDGEKNFSLKRDANHWMASVEKTPYDLRKNIAQGDIQNSLYLSLDEACALTSLAASLEEIFSWDINFGTDLREGDTYSILYEERWRKGLFVGPGKVLAARFENQGKTFEAVFFEGRNGDKGYFDPNGNSLQRKFLKSPLRFKTISSPFSKNRLHPILKIRKPHLGIDFAAPYGTPVRSSADGLVVFKGKNGGMGKMIKIRHNQTFSSAYGHLSRYSKKIEIGRSIKQGEVLGYVGSSGLATAPHLHYSFYQKGRLVNPLNIKNPNVRFLSPSELDEFKKRARNFLYQIAPSPARIFTASHSASKT